MTTKRVSHVLAACPNARSATYELGVSARKLEIGKEKVVFFPPNFHVAVLTIDVTLVPLALLKIKTFGPK